MWSKFGPFWKPVKVIELARSSYLANKNGRFLPAWFSPTKMLSDSAEMAINAKMLHNLFYQHFGFSVKSRNTATNTIDARLCSSKKSSQSSWADCVLLMTLIKFLQDVLLVSSSQNCFCRVWNHIFVKRSVDENHRICWPPMKIKESKIMSILGPILDGMYFVTFFCRIFVKFGEFEMSSFLTSSNQKF